MTLASREKRLKPVSTKCRLQTAADHYFHHANENETRIFPLFSNPENNSLQSVSSLNFVMSRLKCKETVTLERLRITFKANVNLSHVTKFFLTLCFTVHQFY